MKDCCKTGDEPKPSRLKIWSTRIVWGIVLVIIISVVIEQILN